jgi:hypothetical protein
MKHDLEYYEQIASHMCNACGMLFHDLDPEPIVDDCTGEMFDVTRALEEYEEWMAGLSEEELISHLAEEWGETVEEFEVRTFAAMAEEIMLGTEDEEE